MPLRKIIVVNNLVGRDKLNELAPNSLHDRWYKSNPVPLTEKSQVVEILEMVV